LENSNLLKTSKWKVIIPIALLVICVAFDQWIKVYVKTHFTINEVRNVFGHWFQLYFIENEGMAFGITWGGKIGKLLLTAFRLAVSCFGAWYLYKNIKKGSPMGLLLAISLIMAGAIGNIIDSVFYGVWFKDRNLYPGGYFMGQVVDMFYAPVIEGHFPAWFPIWKNEPFTFFSPIWNTADACITIGVFIIIIGQKRFFTHHNPQITPGNDARAMENDMGNDLENVAEDLPAENPPNF
jgi:signal peptidase II